jgi:hypothetical protein
MTDKQTNYDEEVRHAYRDIASERAPNALDQAVLKRARRAVQPAYARSRAWTRPVAWAATVALCVAVVLEVAQLPDAPVVPEVMQSAPKPVPLDKRAPATPNEQTLKAVTPERFAPVAAQADEQAMLPAATRERRDVGNLAAGQEPAAVEMLSAELPAYIEAEEPCPPAVRDNPDTWAACIQALENAGLADVATEQKRWLHEAFPDIDLR